MPILGFGAVTLGREIDEAASFALLDHAWQLGIRLFDTAEAYGGGNAREGRRRALGVDDVREATDIMHSSELLLGRWIRARGVEREARVHTKTLGDYTPAGIFRGIERSLHRLGCEHVDGFYLHSAPQDPAAAAATLGEVKQRGLAARVGLCNVGLDALRTAHAAAPMDLCQQPYNLAQPEAGAEMIPWCARRGVDFVAYSPLAAGFLTGKYGTRGEFAPEGTRFHVAPGHKDVYFRQPCFDALDRLSAVSESTGIPRYRLALEWVMRRKDISVVLVGATRPEHLDNAVAAERGSIDPDVLAQLEDRPVGGSA